ncbi:hypothetical protein DIPPA_29845 [Diplonema papillatum]|nr:hypothetical protein DIPPA_29845 [Diplonema papillatum]
MAAPAPRAYWFSRDPRNGNCIPYPPDMQVKLEAAFSDEDPGNKQVEFTVCGQVFVVKVSEPYTQTNVGTQLSREVFREAVTTMSFTKKDPGFYVACLKHIEFVGSVMSRIRENPSREPVFPPFPEAIACVLELYDDMVSNFGLDRYIREFGGQKCLFQRYAKTPEGHEVERYFANMKSGSIYKRKILSLVGLRNLIRQGKDIYTELYRKKFASNPGQYGKDEGPNKMERLTGNVVDLDTVVVRCSGEEIKELVNKERAKDGQPPLHSTREVADCETVRRMVLNSAGELLGNFIATFNLSADEQEDRQCFVPPPDYVIKVATRHTDRGRWPVWQYINGPANSYHVNVPLIDDVVGALLLAPWHAAKAYCLIMAKYDGAEDKLDDFYRNCIDDTCFNGKWKSIELFNEDLEKRDTVSAVLASMQKEHQQRFCKIYDEVDDEQKCDEAVIAAMWELVVAAQAQGELKDGAKVSITRDMVDAWVRNPSIEF